MPPIEWKKTSVDDISDKGLLSKYKKNSYHSTSKKKKKKEEMCRQYKHFSPKEDIQMTLKRCTTSLCTRADI